MATSLESNTECGLLEFSTEQSIFEVGGVRIGGHPGANPTVLIGSAFYHGHKVNVDEDTGEFDAEEAEKRIRVQDEFSELTGSPCMLDVVGATPQAMERHLEFAAEVTQAPLLIDGTTVEVRLAGLEYVARSGLADRIVYNSIQPGIDDEELTAIREAGVNSAILLTYYLQDFTGKGRVQAVREMLPRLQEAGIQKLIVDTCVMDLATMGQACSAMHDVKHEFGLPVGGGVHNAVSMWRGLKTKMGKEADKPCTASALALAVGVGADFLMYGPVEDAKYAFPAVAMVDTMLSQIFIERGGQLEKTHPRFRIG
ncbi:MAG: tetrahydromethanopterin S-methyltransferase subunit H [Fuerstiella sp.]|nr:tetrahydromethanopterin S-methyltransferase subunit H [Fuerstiella sp.]MCP4854870.1 tetrahydromethanopterin S-methyltransferase subunit H [Fuerstiella sp.]